MKRFTKIVAVKRFAQIAVIQDGDRKAFTVVVWKAEAPTPVQVGPPLSYASDGVLSSAREVRKVAHGVANRLAAQFFQGLSVSEAPEGEASPFAVQHMSAEWADRLIEASASELAQAAAAQGLGLPDVEEPEAWPLSAAEEQALDAAAAAKAQGMSPKHQEAAAAGRTRRRP